MCGRFININKINKLKKIFDIKQYNESLEDTLSYNIAPSNNVNIIKERHKENQFIVNPPIKNEYFQTYSVVILKNVVFPPIFHFFFGHFFLIEIFEEMCY